MKAKKLLTLALACTLALPIAACGGSPDASTAQGDAAAANSSAGQESEAQTPDTAAQAGEDVPVIGFVVFDYSGMYMSYVRKGVENYCADGKAVVEMYDSANDQNKQNDQVATLIEKDVDMLLVSLVDPGGADVILDMAAEADIPVCFVDRAPLLEQNVLDKYEKSWFVGIGWREPGLEQAELVKEKWLADMETMDKNGDGVLQYVICQGNIAQQDGIHRTQAVQDMFAQWDGEGVMKAELLDVQEGSWQTTKAKEIMDTWYVKYGNQIEAVISNNDAMAMGIIETLKENGTYDDPSTVIPVFGINGLPDIQDMLENGQLAGTILTSPWDEACLCVDTLLNVYYGRDVLDGIDLEFGEWKDIRITNKMITNENKDEAKQAYDNCL